MRGRTGHAHSYTPRSELRWLFFFDGGASVFSKMASSVCTFRSPPTLSVRALRAQRIPESLTGSQSCFHNFSANRLR